MEATQQQIQNLHDSFEQLLPYSSQEEEQRISYTLMVPKYFHEIENFEVNTGLLNDEKWLYVESGFMMDVENQQVRQVVSRPLRTKMQLPTTIDMARPVSKELSIDDSCNWLRITMQKMNK